MNNMTSGEKKHRESAKSESCQMAKMFFFLSSCSSDGLVQNCVMLSQRLLHSTLHWVVHQSIAFSQLQSLTRQFKPITIELWLHLCHHFFKHYTHVQICYPNISLHF